MKKTRLASHCAFILFGTFLIGCSVNSHLDQRVIVIAVENLGVNQVNCLNDNQDATRSGFAVLCQESIRFTHAYTSSLQSGPALASILTGKDPIETSYRGQSDSFLPSHEVTLSEKLLSKKISSSFFSGGAPIFRKTNLHQGFELFDDFFKPSISRMYRPFSHLIPLFQNWFKENRYSSFLSVFYLPDLLFTEVQTYDDLGKTRNLSFESQLEEIDETLYSLIQYLKSEKIWNSTTVILVGLNGQNHLNRNSELMQTNLFSERTQIAVLIKPPQKERDLGINWSVNQNVSITDLGYTLPALFAIPSAANSQRTNLMPFLSDSQESKTPTRPILTESFWHEQSKPRISVRLGPYLIIYDVRWKIFNSFIDKNETAPISLNDPSLEDNKFVFESIIYEKNIDPWEEPNIETSIKWRSLNEIYSPEKESSTRSQIIQKTAHRLLEDQTFQSLYALELLRSDNWLDLQRWAIGLKNEDLELIALTNLSKGYNRSFNSPCLRALDGLERFGEISRKCDEKLPYMFLEWLEFELKDKDPSPQKEAAKAKFMRNYLLAEFDLRLTEFNWRYEAPFDVVSKIDPQILTLEMMLAFPKTKKFRQIINREIKSLHESL